MAKRSEETHMAMPDIAGVLLVSILITVAVVWIPQRIETLWIIHVSRWVTYGMRSLCRTPSP